MSAEHKYAMVLIAVMALVTALLRFFPFLLFSQKSPRLLEYLGTVLPYSIMAMLLVYCLKGVDLFGATHAIPEIVSVLLVLLLHKWKHNTLLSIVCASLCYMLFVQIIF